MVALGDSLVLELRAIDILKRAGYKVVRYDRDPFDFIATHPIGVRLIKITSNPVSELEIENLRCVECPKYVSKEVWIFEGDEADPHIKIL